MRIYHVRTTNTLVMLPIRNIVSPSGAVVEPFLIVPYPNDSNLWPWYATAATTPG